MTQWNSYGFDNVNIYNYTVLLTFPNKSSLNVLNIVSSNDFEHVLFEANTTLEKPLVDGEDNPNVVPPYNAYSGIGAVNVSNGCSLMHLTLKMSLENCVEIFALVIIT